MRRTVWLLLAAGCAGDPATDKDPACDAFADADGDGYGDPSAPDCDGVADATDCDDADPAVNPGAPEQCTPAAVDDDCDGSADDADPEGALGVDHWPDADGDGSGAAGSEPVSRCEAGAGWSADATDCDDADPNAFVDAAAELPGACARDADGDGFGDATAPPGGVAGTDCDDADPEAYLGAVEWVGDGVDQDCDTVDPYAWTDGFEAGAPDPAVWSTMDGVIERSDQAAVGDAALQIGDARWVYDNAGAITTVTVDTSRCVGLGWSAAVGFADAAPALSALTVEVRAVGGWRPVQAVWGVADSTAFRWFGARLDDADLRHPAFAMRLSASGGRYLVDEFRLACSGDDPDGDAVGDRDDCAPADADHFADCGVCDDPDGDGHGTGCDLGTDCDEADPDRNPGVTEVPADGTDQTCDGIDAPVVQDDFQGGRQDPAVWIAMGDHYFENNGHPGSYEDRTLRLWGASFAESVPVDLSGCTSIAWSFWARSDDLGLRLSGSPDGVTWTELAAAAPQDDNVVLTGTSTDAALLADGFRLRVDNVDPDYADTVQIDDVWLTCAGPDDDGDGRPAGFDCDDQHVLHYADCATCLDGDGDGFGAACDAGDECDDDDALAFPHATDPFGDGVDQSCDGVDGPTIADTFDDALDFGLWDEISDYRAPFGGVLYLGQGDALTSFPIDTSTCTELGWFYVAELDTFEVGDAMVLERSDGGAWLELDRLVSDGAVEPPQVVRWGVVPSAASTRIRLRYESDGYTGVLIDRLLVGCTEPDADGDGIPAPIDCDPDGADHWFDCDACVDADNDGFGDACDLGSDCDDADPATHPGADDASVDGSDHYCDGIDGPPGFTDDFEGGAVDPVRWEFEDGRLEVAPLGPGCPSATPGCGLGLTFGSDGELRSAPIDASGCGAVAWTYAVMRHWAWSGTDVLDLEWTVDGVTWRRADRNLGDSSSGAETAYRRRGGVIGDTSAAAATLQIRFIADNQFGTVPRLFDVDDVALGCAP